jgi:light-regulated signal transduction histidine kinase (bacteriophytochrome)
MFPASPGRRQNASSCMPSRHQCWTSDRNRAYRTDSEDLFLLFEQRSDDRTGVGMGLGITRHGVEVNGGTLCVRNLPDRGCVFTIDLPMLTSAT